MTYLEAVNIVLREGGIIAGDDDEVVSFSETQHENHLNLAKRSIKRELNDLLSDKSLPYEKAEGYITLVANQRLYSVESDFVKFSDERPFMLEVDSATSTGVSQNRKVYHYEGDEPKLRRVLDNYRDVKGQPIWFYVADGSTRQVGFYNVPSNDHAGEVYRYFYDKSLTVSTETDTIPLINEAAAESFAEGCGVHFNYLRMTPMERQQFFPNGLQNDPGLQQARAKTMEFITVIPPEKKYGRDYA